MATLRLPASDPESLTASQRRGNWLYRAVPTALVTALLAGVAYWGHRSDWKFVSASPKPGAVAQEDRKLWVEAGPGRPNSDLCSEHGLPSCPSCNPDIAQLPKRPRSTPADRERIRRALAARERPGVDAAALRLPRVIRFASADAVDEAGIDIVPAWTATVTEAIPGSGEVGFHPTRYARLTSKAPGTTWRVFSQIGDVVRAGDVLALVDAAEVGKAKAELQVALVQVRLKSQAVLDLAAAPVQGRQRKEADAALKETEIRLIAAEQALLNLGFPVRIAELRSVAPATVADRLQKLGVPSELWMPAGRESLPGNLLPVRSPIDGLVLRASVVAGEPVDATKVLFHVADPRMLRLTVHVPPAEVQWVKVDQEIRFQPDGGNAEAIGRTVAVGVTADETTRTVPVWADVPNPAAGLRLIIPLLKLLGGGAANVANPDGGLRASTLGTGRVVLREELEAVLVPSIAIHTIAGSAVVFVRDKGFHDDGGPKTFHVRAIMIGAREGNNSEVIVGLLPGEVVASKGSAVLAEELRKALAAGK